MNQQRSPHQNLEVLAAFGSGKLDDALAETVSDHLRTCAECSGIVAGLRNDPSIGAPPDAIKPDHGGTQVFQMPERSKRDSRDEDPDAAAGRRNKNSPVGPTPELTSGELPTGLGDDPDYQIIRKLGEGGMGVVYLARYKPFDRLQVLKILNKQMPDNSVARKRLQTEMRAVARLQHENIVTAYSVPRMGDLLVFAMEYVDGQSLERRIKLRGRLSIAHACDCGRQVAHGLQHAMNKGIVHRDIKPSNLMLGPVKEKREVVKILDFGLAKVAMSEPPGDVRLTQEWRGLGTLLYIAPEQYMDASTADIRADIYSLGVTLYHCLAGEPPFRGDSPKEVLEGHLYREAEPLNVVRPDVPAPLAAVVAKMMAKHPEDRYQIPADVAEALAPFCGDEGSRFSSPSQDLISETGSGNDLRIDSNSTLADSRLLAGDAPQRRQPARFNRAAMVAVALVALGVAGALGVWAYSNRPETTVANHLDNEQWRLQYLQPVESSAKSFAKNVDEYLFDLGSLVFPTTEQTDDLIRSENDFQTKFGAAKNEQMGTPEQKGQLKISDDDHGRAKAKLEHQVETFLGSVEEAAKNAKTTRNRQWFQDFAVPKILPPLEALASAKILAGETPKRIDELHALCRTAMEGVEIAGPNVGPLGHSRDPIARVGDRYAGIDVGSRGVKFVMLEVADRGGVRVPTILTGKDNEDEVKNSGLNDSAALTQKYSQEALEATVDAVKKFVEKARNRGVPDDHIFVVGSSGLARAANREELKTLVRRATQAPGHKELDIGFIGHQDEVGLTFLDVVPQGSRDTSFVLDIGSGNTKFGYATFSADKKWTGRAAQLSYATATFRDRAKIGCRFTKPGDPLQSAVEFADQAKAVRGELKIDQALEIEEAKVDLGHRPRLYLSGGIVWALVTILKPDQVGQAEVPVTKADIQKFRELVRKPTDQIFAAVNFKVVAPAEQDQARQELLGKNGIQKVFASYTEKDPKNPDKKIPYPVPHADLIAGAEILDAVANTLDFDHLEVIFPRKAKDAWIRSYVLFEADFAFGEQSLPVKTATEKVDSDAETIARLQAKVNELTQQLAATKQQFAASQIGIDPIKTQLVDLQNEQQVSRKGLDKVSLQLAELQQQHRSLATQNGLDALSTEQKLIGSQIESLHDSLRTLQDSIQALRQQSLREPRIAPQSPGSPQTLNGAPNPPEPIRAVRVSALARDAADRVFYAGLEHYTSGRFADAYRCFCSASEGNDVSQFWFGRAVAAWQLNFQGDFQMSAERACRCMRSGEHSSYEEVCRMFSRVQGPARRAADIIIRER